jgi:pimeloyl-ACP methyl ester carboxylesterase
MTMMTVNGVRLAYEISGTGDIPLIMVHGGFESRRAWDWAGHPIMVEQPEDFAEAINAFVRRHTE